MVCQHSLSYERNTGCMSHCADAAWSFMVVHGRFGDGFGRLGQRQET